MRDATFGRNRAARLDDARIPSPCYLYNEEGTPGYFVIAEPGCIAVYGNDGRGLVGRLRLKDALQLLSGCLEE